MPKIGEPSTSKGEEKADTNSVLLQALSALRLVMENVAAQQIPVPPKFHIGDDYDWWKSQLRRYLLSRRRKTQDRDAFRYCTQRTDETAQRFAAEPRKLAALAFLECEAAFRELMLLYQFADGVRSAAVQNSFVERPPESLKEAVTRAALLEEPRVATDAPPNLNAPTNSPPDCSQRPRQYVGRRRQPRDRRGRPWVARENAEDPSSIESHQDAYFPFVCSMPLITLPTIIGSINGDNGRMLVDTELAVTLVRDAPTFPSNAHHQDGNSGQRTTQG
ncbi:unnamed protein product [Echinostoma caproni]|uniref:Retrotrans_gag domain-containing protein n=1 Tax=Echinostoma caproni TaxID=27848 RepID=A0A183BCG8_9TREM|nr:unnamed protein product [Echinostoma caproni]